MKITPSQKNLKEFGLLMGFMFPFLIGFLFPLVSGHSFKIWTIYVSFPFVFLSIIKPQLLSLPYKLWMKLGLILGFINSRIILGLVYFLVLLPISFVMKIFGYDPLSVKNRNKKSYSIKNKSSNVNFHKIF